MGEQVNVYLADLRQLAGLVTGTIYDSSLVRAFISGLQQDIKSHSLTITQFPEVVEKSRSLTASKDVYFANVSFNGKGG